MPCTQRGEDEPGIWSQKRWSELNLVDACNSFGDDVLYLLQKQWFEQLHSVVL